jgi:uncharacterized coiled-coil DUF342 family protein
LAGRRAIFFWPNAYRLSSSGSRHAKTENIGDEAQSGEVHIKQMLERHEHDRDEGDPAREAIEELKQAIDALKETLEELRTKF